VVDVTERIERSGLRVAAELDAFVAQELLGPLALSPETFWAGTAALLARLTPRNLELLARRRELQARLDGWHGDHRGPGDPAAYEEFLSEIGYLEPDPGPVTIDVEHVDPEIATIAGPQLVVPLDNARFALNAANARWGSLYDALYGTDVVPQVDPSPTPGYDPARGELVIAYANEFLDDSFPLATGSHSDAVEYEVTGSSPHRLAVTLVDGTTTTLAHSAQLVGFRRGDGDTRIVLAHHGLHLQLVVDREHPIGRQHPAGVADVIVEAAVTTIEDCEDAVSAVDSSDKLNVYRNWLGLMDGTLTAEFDKGGRTLTRRLEFDLDLTGVDGAPLTLSGRSLLLVRNVGIHMMTDAVLAADGSEVPEGILDALITVAAALHDLRHLGRYVNSAAGSIYIVKPKLHGSEEVAFAAQVFAEVEELLGLPEHTIKIGIMDEERRTSLNLGACIAAARHRVIFINTGFLDRTGDEIHTARAAGAMIRKGEMRTSHWLAAYEDRNVDVGLGSGFHGHAQVGKGMWAMPDKMAEMMATKVGHPMAGASCAWVPSPTAATLHALHYHQVDVAARQEELVKRAPTGVTPLLQVPLLDRTLTPDEVTEEIRNNAQGILGYVVRWVQQGIGCSKVLDIHDVALMEDRATLRISSQHLANWLRHGIVDAQTVTATFREMAAIVDAQNAADPAYRPMVTNIDDSVAFTAALELVFSGMDAPNGYTEPVLHAARRRVKAGAPG
jgi:malate synthase